MIKFTKRDIEENIENAVAMLSYDISANMLWADRCPVGMVIDTNPVTNWNESKKVQIYWLLDSDNKPFYVGQSASVKERVSTHRRVVSTNDYTDKDFTYEIVDEIEAPELFFMKLEFMYIVNCILLYSIDNSFYRKYAGWCIYSNEDIELLHECVINKVSFQEYQLESSRLHFHRTSRSFDLA